MVNLGNIVKNTQDEIEEDIKEEIEKNFEEDIEEIFLVEAVIKI